jgi:hypothetical protein
MKRFAILLAMGAATVVATAALVRLSRLPLADDDAPGAEAPVAPVTAAVNRPAPPVLVRESLDPAPGPAAGVKRPLEEEISAARQQVRDPVTLAAYLDDLERRARGQEVVTDHELLPGIAAIETTHGPSGADAVRREVEAFRARMVDLSRAFVATRAPQSSHASTHPIEPIHVSEGESR